MMIEDKIVEALANVEPEFDDRVCTKYAEFECGEIGGYATAYYYWHEEEDWQTFDGRCMLVQTEYVVDEVRDIEICCRDMNTGKNVNVKTDYILEKI